MAAILDEDQKVSTQALYIAGGIGFSTPEMIRALRQRKSEPDDDLAVQATAALIRLNYLERLDGLTDALSDWRDDKPAQGIVGGALWEVTDPKSALAIVPLVGHDNAAVRKARPTRCAMSGPRRPWLRSPALWMTPKR